MISDINLKSIFDSNICSQVVTRELFRHFDTFPEFHENSKTMSSVYKGNWVQLRHCQSVIAETFGKEFSEQKCLVTDKDGNRIEIDKKCNGMHVSPVRYTIDGFLMSCDDREKMAKEFM